MTDMEQLLLDYYADRSKTIQERFEQFHAENPDVYHRLVDLAYQAKAHGARRIGISLLFERLRWEIGIETRSWDGFRLNNNLRSRYARLIEAEHPKLRGLFETRELRAA